MKKLSVSMTRAETIGTWSYLLFQMLPLPFLLYLISALLPTPLSDANINFLLFSINFICVTVLCRKFLIASVRKATDAPFQCLKAAFLGFLLYYLVSIFVNLVVMYLNPSFVNENDSSIQEMTNNSYTLMSIGVVFLVPTVEEVFYRGLIFRGIYNRSRVLAYIVSSAAFSLIHIVGYLNVYSPLSLALSFLQYLPAGLCLGWAYAKADTIAAPILLHMCVNQIAISAMR